MNATTTRITLLLGLDGDTVEGRTIGADGSERAFTGWMGLMGVLDALLDEARGAADGDGHTENPANGEERTR